MSELITYNRLREVLYYDPDTGIFIWKCNMHSRVHTGDVAGSDNGRGYLRTEIDGKAYLIHRLAWFYFYGEWPSKYIDHRDQNKTNNKITNLRLATKSDNGANRGPSIRNRCGLKGVAWRSDTQKWIAQICKSGSNVYLGQFSTPEEAHEVYMREAKRVFGEFAHIGGL